MGCAIEQLAGCLERQQVEGDVRVLGDLDLGDLQPVRWPSRGAASPAGRVFAFALAGLPSSMPSSLASWRRCSGFTSPLSQHGAPSWPMETKQPASFFCSASKPMKAASCFSASSSRSRIDLLLLQ